MKPSEGAETQGYKNLLTRNDGIVLYALCTMHRTLFSFDIDVIELQTEQTQNTNTDRHRTTGLVGLFFYEIKSNPWAELHTLKHTHIYPRIERFTIGMVGEERRRRAAPAAAVVGGAVHPSIHFSKYIFISGKIP